MKFAALILVLGFGACATAPRVAEVETVGSLAPSYRSIATAPVAKSTDLGVSYQAVSGDADAETTEHVVADVVAAPDVAAKVAHGF